MIAILTALLLTIASQAEADCDKLCDRDWWKTATAADVQTELDGGADVMARTFDGNTPLHIVKHSNIDKEGDSLQDRRLGLGSVLL